ncbi:MAG TPA: DUF6507 family protein [Actinotalea caeni]|uniref:DUF6507 family protein n=1 Tax=Actinotalea caeni TaxID=1348467 RepID=UPI0012E17D97|nr:DUF6507 family protein [Actinotalea caeni]HLV57129.1 DUF6507 family protein [Actinotalea caeni]
MTRWRINPAGVQEVLTNVETDRGELNKALAEKKFTEIFEGLSWGSYITADVPAALNNLLQDQATRLTNIGNRINACVVGVSNATIAYNNGQHEMAATFQSEAVSAAETGDFQYFVDNGYQA